MFRILSPSSTEPPLSFRSCVSPGREVWHCLVGSFCTLECLETSLGFGGASTWFHSSGTLIRGRGRSPELSPKGCGGGFCNSSNNSNIKNNDNNNSNNNSNNNTSNSNSNSNSNGNSASLHPVVSAVSLAAQLVAQCYLFRFVQAAVCTARRGVLSNVVIRRFTQCCNACLL